MKKDAIPVLGTTLLFCTLTTRPPLWAQDSILQLDPAETTINFTLGATLHTVHGIFKLKSGVIHFNPASGEASGAILVDAASGDSENEARDRDMHRKVLESERYPEIAFAVDRFEGRVAPEGQSDLQVHGALSLHGLEHEMTADVSLQTAGDQATATTHLIIPYVKWGLKNPSTLFLRVRDTVEVEIHAVGHLTKGGT